MVNQGRGVNGFMKGWGHGTVGVRSFMTVVGRCGGEGREAAHDDMVVVRSFMTTVWRCGGAGRDAAHDLYVGGVVS